MKTLLNAAFAVVLASASLFPAQAGGPGASPAIGMPPVQVKSLDLYYECLGKQLHTGISLGKITPQYLNFIVSWCKKNYNNYKG